MEELLKQLKEKAGLTEEQSKKALSTITDYIRSKVPPMMHGLIDNFLGEALNDQQQNINATPAPSKPDLINKAEKVKQETVKKIEGLVEEAKEEVEDFAKDASIKIDEWAVKADEAAIDAISKLREMMNEQQNHIKTDNK